MKVVRTAVALLLLAPLLGQRSLEAKQPPTAESNVLVATMEKELRRGQAELAKQDPAPYFTNYAVADSDALLVVGAQGGVLTSSRVRRRGAAVSMRIGTPDLDNTHEEQRSSGISSGQFPLRDDPDALARVLWTLTYEQYLSLARPVLLFDELQIKRSEATKQKLPEYPAPALSGGRK